MLQYCLVSTTTLFNDVVREIERIGSMSFECKKCRKWCTTIKLDWAFQLNLFACRAHRILIGLKRVIAGFVLHHNLQNNFWCLRLIEYPSCGNSFGVGACNQLMKVVIYLVFAKKEKKKREIEWGKTGKGSKYESTIVLHGLMNTIRIIMISKCHEACMKENIEWCTYT